MASGPGTEAAPTGADPTERVWVRLAPVSALPVGQSVSVDVDGRRIALFHRPEGLMAIDDECLHQGGPLSEGEVVDGTVICPWHRWRYSLATGERTDLQGSPVCAHPVEVRAGMIYVSVPA